MLSDNRIRTYFDSFGDLRPFVNYCCLMNHITSRIFAWSKGRFQFRFGNQFILYIGIALKTMNANLTIYHKHFEAATHHRALPVYETEGPIRGLTRSY